MKKKLEEQLREQSEKLKRIKEKGQANLISFLMLNTVDNCMRAYKYCYLDKIKSEDNIYTYLGTTAHTLLEQLYRDEVTNKQAVEEWIKAMKNTNLLFIDYTKAESPVYSVAMKEKNDKYEKSYKELMIHYFENFKKEQYKDFLQERTVILELSKKFNKLPYNSYIFNGKVDFIGINEDNSIDIIDYKTSTLYKKEKLELHSFQLILYAMALEDLGYKINRIGWNFLKYTTKITRYKNGNVKETLKKRSEIEDNMEFKDGLVFIDYNRDNKLKAMKWVYNNIFKIHKLKGYSKVDSNRIPCMYDEFSCPNLCPYFKICSLR